MAMKAMLHSGPSSLSGAHSATWGPLTRVSIDDYVRTPLFGVAGTACIGEVLKLIEQWEVSAVPVLSDAGVPCGVVSRTNLLRAASAGYQSEALRGYSFETSKTTAAQIMHPGIITVRRGSWVAEAARQMAKHRVHRVFVEGEGGLVAGVFGTRELMRAIGDARLMTPVGALMSRRPSTIPCEMSVALATSRLSVAKTTGLVVVDANAWPVGLFTQREALLARNLPARATVDEVMSQALTFSGPDTPIHRAASRAVETLTRRVLVVEKATVSGIVAPLDFARLAAHGE